MQDGHEAAAGEREHILHPAGVVSKDPSALSFLLLISCYFSVMGLGPVPLVSPASYARGAYAAADGGRGARTPSSIVCSDPRNPRSVLTTRLCLCWKSILQILREQYVPTVRDACTAAAGVHFPSTPCRNYRPYEQWGPTILFDKLWLVDFEEPEPLSSGLVCVDSARPRCSRCCRVRGPHRPECRIYRHVRRSRSDHHYSLFEFKGPGPFPAISSLTITEGSNAVAAALRCTSIP